MTKAIDNSVAHEVERYRMTVFGTPRDDRETAIVAISHQANRLSVASKAIDSFISEHEDTIDTSLLSGALDIIGEAVQTIDSAACILDELGEE